MKKKLKSIFPIMMLIILGLLFTSCDLSEDSPSLSLAEQVAQMEEITLTIPENLSQLSTETTELEWVGIDIEGYTYDVYFSDVFPFTEEPILTKTSELSYTVTIAEGLNYYWQIVATSELDDIGIKSPVYMFSTEEAETVPEPELYGSFPLSGSTIESRIVTELRWNSIESDSDGLFYTTVSATGPVLDTEGNSVSYLSDELSYDVYFGETYTDGDAIESLPQIVHNITGDTDTPARTVTLEQILNNAGYTAQDLTSLPNGTKYYWGVIATDVEGNTISSPVWDFTTAVNNAPYKATLTEPANGSVDVVNSDILKWTSNEDFDHDNISCDVIISTDKTFATTSATISNVVVLSEAVVDDIDVWTFNALIPSSLLSSTTYYWKVNVTDGTTVTTSDVSTFTTDSSYNTNKSFSLKEDFTKLTGVIGTDDELELLNPTNATVLVNSVQGNTYPSLEIPNGESISTTPINAFTQATLSFDTKVNTEVNTSVFKIEDSTNPTANIVELKVAKGVKQHTDVTVGIIADLDEAETWTFTAGTKTYTVYYDDTTDATGTNPVLDDTIIVTYNKSLATPESVAESTRVALALISQRDYTFEVSGTSSKVEILSTNVGVVTDADTTAISWSSDINSIYTYENLQTHLYAKTYNAEDEFEQYKWTLVDTFSYGKWATINITLNGDYTYNVSLNGGTESIITYGETLSTLSDIDTTGALLKTSLHADKISILAGNETLFIDNIDFTITESTWVK